MKNRIKDLFEKKKGNILSVFYTAGFPTLGSTVPIADALTKAGADIIVVGSSIEKEPSLIVSMAEAVHAVGISRKQL